MHADVFGVQQNRAIARLLDGNPRGARGRLRRRLGGRAAIGHGGALQENDQTQRREQKGWSHASIVSEQKGGVITIRRNCQLIKDK
jgi:hypothetical protein